MRNRLFQSIIDAIKTEIGFKKYCIPYNAPKNTYKKLICVTGFGHSGSGAILDYLSEFENVTVLGFHDENGTGYKAKDKKLDCEVDFIRCVGGVFDIEKAFSYGGYFYGDYAVKLFLHIAEYFYRRGGIYNNKFWQLCKDFINEIVDYKIPTDGSGLNGRYMLGFRCNWRRYLNLSSALCVNNHCRQNYIYYLKKISVEEYCRIAKKFITSFLNTIESQDYLVMDQVITTSRADVEHKLKYFNDFKLLCVYRDPRDVYATGILKSEDWIPKNPYDFCKWYVDRGVLSYLTDRSLKKKMFRFEDLVMNYEAVIDEVNNFLNLDATKHIFRKKYFNPEISKKNIKLYNQLDCKENLRIIERELGEYCYKEN